MEIEILGQGIEPLSEKAVGNVLMKCFSDTDFNSFTAISAFATISGVKGISKFISEATHLKNNLIVVGVNEKVTSKEALEEIIKIENTNSYVFYANNNSIFHPKIYLFEGNLKSILIIGSSNLTGRGLFTNIEASLQVSIDNNIDKDRKIIEQLKQYFKGLFEQTDENLKIISSELIDNLVKSGIVPTEAQQKESRAKSKKNSSKETDDLISKIFPKRAMAKIPKEFTSLSERNKNKAVVVDSKSKFKIIESNLLWKKLSLSNSDAQHVPNGTQPTYNLKLSQAKFKIKDKIIDQKIYFRENVFKKLEWQNTKKDNLDYQETHCNFDIIVNNTYLGIQKLKLSHDSKRISGQGNTPTWLHWNDILVAYFQSNIVYQKSLSLYSTDEENKFQLVIE
jgi:HKD family nuclease